MPTYTYKCPECKHTSDFNHLMMDSPTILCPKCTIQMKKVPSVASVTFKGQGWGSDL